MVPRPVDVILRNAEGIEIPSRPGHQALLVTGLYNTDTLRPLVELWSAYNTAPDANDI